MAAPVQQYGRRGVEKLTPEVNRILFVKNIPFKITPEEMYDVFGRYGPVRQIRIGSTNATRGTAFVIYENVLDAKQACEHLSGYNFNSRYLVCLFYIPGKAAERMPNEEAREKLGEVSVRSGIVTGARLTRGGGASSAIPLNSLLAGSERVTQTKKSAEGGDGEK